MRNDDYYVNLDRKVKQQEIEREQLEVAIKEYLAKGGKITHVPVGVSTLGAIADHESRRKLERIKNFGDK
jgi:hypothetical protein